MKQNIGIGTVVDDGTGDYLRRGGEKINANFNELYSGLGDGQVPHPAGAWKNYSSTDALRPVFGQAYNINTTTGAVIVNLPEGRVGDYGKVIRLRDVWGVWGTNPVTLVPSGSNTIKGSSTTKKLNRDYQDVELVLTSPGSWEYLDNKMVNKLSSTEIATVARKEFIATQGQKDFLRVFGDSSYNPKNIEVYRRGNLLFYGVDFTADSDFGSPGTGSAVVALNGRDIRLKVPCEEGDAVTIVTYMDDLAVYRSSYIANTITVWNSESGRTQVNGQTFVGDIASKREWTLTELGFQEVDGQLNPESTEVLINGRVLTQAGKGGLPAFACETTAGDRVPGDTEADCIAASGQWVESGIDFSVLKDKTTGRLSRIKIYEFLENGDQLTVRWFNNDIGTVMEWDEIKEHADEIYLNNENRFTRSQTIRYNDYGNPNPCTVEVEDRVEENIKLTDIMSLLNTIHPVGTVYMNAHNPNNPKTYMGFGRWVPYAQGEAIVGWDHEDDGNFSYYDGTCGKLKSPGGSGGSVQTELTIDQIPTVRSDDKVLVKDPDGDVLIGRCLLDPDDTGPGYRTYREDVLASNVHSNTKALSLLQPYRTVAAWLRVE